MQAVINDAMLSMGFGVGKELMNEINQCQRELTIVSPCLTSSQLKLLMEMHDRGIKVQLVTTISEGTIGNVDGYDYRTELIRQYKYKDKQASEKKDSLRGLVSFFWFALLAFLLGAIFSFFYYYAYAQWVMLSLALATVVVMIATFVELKSISLYRYTYKTLFPIRVFVDPSNRKIKNLSTHFVHAKLFLKDAKVAYLGSANFTCSTSDNYESVIKVQDPLVIGELQREVDLLFGNNYKEMDFVDLDEWGRMVYEEPKK